MKTVLSALFVSAFIASPAMACNWMKSAEKKSTYTASAEEVTEDAITTFDPAEKPVFETEAVDDAADGVIEEQKAD